MKINDLSQHSHLECMIQAPEQNGKQVPFVAAEHWMEVFVNEQPAMRVVCTPEHLDELVVGRLITEGLIQNAEDIQSIYICEHGLRARVMLREGLEVELADEEAMEINSCCTDNRTRIKKRSEISAVKPIHWEADQLRAIFDRMHSEESIYSATHAVHACYLADQNDVLCCREDLGRHNALDKVIGWACIHHIDVSQCVLFTTGRMPSDMVSKAARSGVPVIASKTYPSDLGIEMARQTRLTLVTVKGNGDLYLWNDGA